MPASPRLIAGLSSSASAGPIGCTSGRDALEPGALKFGGFARGDRGDLGLSGDLAITGQYGQNRAAMEGRACPFPERLQGELVQ
jgi:hypothetical protein